MSLKTGVMFINGLRGRGHQRWYADKLAEAAGALPQLSDCGVFRVKARTRGFDRRAFNNSAVSMA